MSVGVVAVKIVENVQGYYEEDARRIKYIGEDLLLKFIQNTLSDKIEEVKKFFENEKKVLNKKGYNDDEFYFKIKYEVKFGSFDKTKTPCEMMFVFIRTYVVTQHYTHCYSKVRSKVVYTSYDYTKEVNELGYEIRERVKRTEIIEKI